MVDNAVLQNILSFGPVFLLIAVRAFAMIQTAPLLSSDAIPMVVKFSLAGLVAFCAIPTAEIYMAENAPIGLVTMPSGFTNTLQYEPFSFSFLLLVIGEGIIGIILGFFMTIIFAVFSTAGQFFSLQMGFGAAETMDPLSQVENPLMGQYLNLVSMLIFITIGGFHQLFLGGFWRSVQSINIISLLEGKDAVVTMVAQGLSRLFVDAIIIALPILGTLFLTSLTTGLISKAAPQINILQEGFPISISVAFILIYASLPFMTEAFVVIINRGFGAIEDLYIQIGRQITAGGY